MMVTKRATASAVGAARPARELQLDHARGGAVGEEPELPDRRPEEGDDRRAYAGGHVHDAGVSGDQHFGPSDHGAGLLEPPLGVLPVRQSHALRDCPRQHIVVQHHDLRDLCRAAEQPSRLLEDPTKAVALAEQGGALTAEVAKLALMPQDSPTRFKGKPGVAKEVAWAAPLPLDEIKTVAKALGASVNDVLLSCVAGALAGYLAQKGDRTDGVAPMVRAATMYSRARTASTCPRVSRA